MPAQYRESLGLPNIPYTRASWLHGWMQYPLTHIELLARDDATVCCEPKAVTNLVATTQQELSLKTMATNTQKP